MYKVIAQLQKLQSFLYCPVTKLQSYYYYTASYQSYYTSQPQSYQNVAPRLRVRQRLSFAEHVVHWRWVPIHLFLKNAMTTRLGFELVLGL